MKLFKLTFLIHVLIASNQIMAQSDSTKTSIKQHTQLVSDLRQADQTSGYDVESAEQKIVSANHLPGFPRLEDLNNGTYNANELTIKMLNHLERLTVVVSQQNKRIGKLESENERLKLEIQTLKEN